MCVEVEYYLRMLKNETKDRLDWWVMTVILIWQNDPIFEIRKVLLQLLLFLYIISKDSLTDKP